MKIKTFDQFNKKINENFDDIDTQKMTALSVPKFNFKQDYPVYHYTFGSVLDSINKYVKDAGYTIEENQFFIAFGDARLKPNEGKTLKRTVDIKDLSGKTIGALHVQIYNRGIEGNTYELTAYAEKI